MPSTVSNYSPQIKCFHFCKRGNRHAQQPLNLVCLDPICRSRSLACPTCFSEYHKYHKTIPLSEFMSDYRGAIKKNHKESIIKRIGKQHQEIVQNLQLFKRKVIQKLDSYQQSVDQYFKFLLNSLNIREQLSKTLNITLDPHKIVQAHSQQQLQESVRFIIEHSLFNQENRLTNISSILKCDQSRTLALLDKVVNQNLRTQGQIQLQLRKLNFTKQTLGKQGLRMVSLVKEFNQHRNSQQEHIQTSTLTLNTKAFIQKQTFYQTLNLTGKNTKPSPQNAIVSKLSDFFILQNSQEGKQEENLLTMFVFSNVYKHDRLVILDQGKQTTVRSNVTALNPQYVLICPSVDCQPQREQNWSIRIKSCRNFASSKNTVAVGLCSLSQVSAQNFQENKSQNMKNQFLLTSQGYLIKNQRQQKCDFTFSTGDTIHLKYDPYYNLLIIYKDNGRKVTIKTQNRQETSSENIQKLYGCVRLTYASDQVQILNHNNLKHH